MYDSFLYTVTIGNVSLNDSGTIVSFSYLRGGGLNNEIQWQGNATLTVTPLSPNTASDEGFPIITLVSILASLLVTAIATAAIILAVCIVWYNRKRKMFSRSSSGINYSELKYSETSE